MSKKKIFNDPIYGFITFPHEILYDIIDHPYFQRLRRISQQGLSHLVYPGAMHTRFQHVLGAMHLTCEAVKSLRSKGIDITPEESEGVCIAILLHDIGHGPFSHALEQNLIPFHHERMSLAIMRSLNEEMDGRLQLGIDIFTGEYFKTFLHQLVSSQLDMDRLDYLTRDSFYTGVVEGVVGYDRLIAMLNVRDNLLVVEEKGIYSIEKFLVARGFMYWQVYLHKTGIAAEQMLISFMKRLKLQYSINKDTPMSMNLKKLLEHNSANDDIDKETIEQFCMLDDSDVIYTLKIQDYGNDEILRFLSKSILNRKLFKIRLQNEPIEDAVEKEIIKNVTNTYSVASNEFKYFVLKGIETNQIYTKNKEKILILKKNGDILPLESISDNVFSGKSIVKYYICGPNI